MSRTLKTLTLAAAGAVVWGTLIERQMFTVRSVTARALEPGSTPIRVLHLSDLHLAPWQSRKIRFIRSLRRLAPDLVIATGDLMGHVDALDALSEALEPFDDVPGVFVFGSNDYYGPMVKNPIKYLKEPSRLATREKDIDNAAVERYLSQDLGWHSLNNDAVVLDVREQPVELFGLNDPHIRYDDPERMRAALQAVRDLTLPVARLGVVHAPYRASLDALLECDADVLFAGHTHGGQVCVPGVGALTTNCDLPKLQAKGLSVWFSERRAAFLNVSAGLGHSIYAPVRFACRPEVTMLTLIARAGD